MKEKCLMLREFDYLQPESVEEAVNMRQKYGEKSIYIAGGTDVLPKMRKQRGPVPPVLISLKKISALSNIYEEDDAINIGALVTHHELERSELIGQTFPVLADAVSQIGSVQIRNVATIGGNLCSSLPSADTSSPLLVLNATLKIFSLSRGEYNLDLKEFFVSSGKNILQEDEILKEIIVPKPGENSGGAYYTISRRNAMEIPLLGAAVYLVVGETGKCNEARISLTTCAPTPLKNEEAAKKLIDQEINEDTLYAVGQIAASNASPRRGSFRCDSDYRIDMIPVVVKRAGMIALKRINLS